VSLTANLKRLSLWRGIWASELEEVSTASRLMRNRLLVNVPASKQARRKF
jgi:hypothetical protein